MAGDCMCRILVSLVLSLHEHHCNHVRRYKLHRPLWFFAETERNSAREHSHYPENRWRHDMGSSSLHGQVVRRISSPFLSALLVS